MIGKQMLWSFKSFVMGSSGWGVHGPFKRLGIPADGAITHLKENIFQRPKENLCTGPRASRIREEDALTIIQRKELSYLPQP